MLILLALSSPASAIRFDKAEQRITQSSNNLFLELYFEVFEALSFVEVSVVEEIGPLALDGLSLLYRTTSARDRYASEQEFTEQIMSIVYPTTSLFSGVPSKGSMSFIIPLCARDADDHHHHYRDFTDPDDEAGNSATLCLFEQSNYRVTANVFETDSKAVLSSSASTLTKNATFSLDKHHIQQVVTETTDSTVSLTWNPPRELAAASSVYYDVRVRYESEGDAPHLEEYMSLDRDLVHELELVSGGGPYSFHTDEGRIELNGCFEVNGDGATHCIAPWTVYQITIDSHGDNVTVRDVVFATTKDGRMKYSTHYDIIVEFPNILVHRSYIPEPWQGDPIAYNLRIQSEYGVVTESNNVSVYLSPHPKSIETFIAISSYTIVERQTHPEDDSPIFAIRFTNLSPYTRYTYWITPITSAGPALVEGGPFYARTLESTANRPPAPVISDSPLGDDYVMVSFAAPVPPYGIITKYDVGVPNAIDVVRFDVLHSATNMSMTNATINVRGIDATSIRVRAYTSVGAGPWSDRAVDMRTPARVSLQESTDNTALGASLGVILPILVVLVVLVVWLMRKRRKDERHPVFPFPPPDRWEIDRSLLEFNELLGMRVCRWTCVVAHTMCRSWSVWQGVACRPATVTAGRLDP